MVSDIESQPGNAPIIEVDFIEARELADLIAIRADLAFVASAADRLADILAQQDEADWILVQALQTAALVAYVRCFSTGRRFGLTEESLSSRSDGAVEFHQHLKDMRDKHVAHSVNPFEQTKIGAVLSADHSEVVGVAQFIARHVAFDPAGALELARFVRDIASRLDPETKRLTDTVQSQASVELHELRHRRGGLGVVIPGPSDSGKAR